MQMIMHVIEACLVLAAVAGQADLRAGEAMGVLAVAPPPGPGPAVAELTMQLRDRMAERRTGVLDAARLRERIAGRDVEAALVSLDLEYEEARAAYTRGEYEESVRALRALVEDLEELPDAPEVFAHWTRAMLRLARSEQSLGRDDASRRHLERLVRAAPDLEIDRTLHPTRVVNEVERARAALRRDPVRTLRVTTSVGGAAVYLQGRPAGRAPLAASVPSGRYRLSAAHGALRAGPVVVDLREADQSVLLDFTVAEALRPAAGPGVAVASGDPAAQIVAAGAYLHLDGVVAVSLVDEDGATHVVGSLYDVPRGVLVREGRVRLASGSVPVGGMSALAEYLLTGDASSGLAEVPGQPRAGAAVDLRAAPTAETTAQPPGLRSALARGVPPASSRTLGWATLGSGVAALALSAVGFVEMRSAEDSYERARRLRATGALATSEGVSRFNALVIEGNDARRNGTIALAGAGVAAATAGILGYVNYRRTGELGPFRF
jgi:hypothetical protein